MMCRKGLQTGQGSRVLVCACVAGFWRTQRCSRTSRDGPMLGLRRARPGFVRGTCTHRLGRPCGWRAKTQKTVTRALQSPQGVLVTGDCHCIQEAFTNHFETLLGVSNNRETAMQWLEQAAAWRQIDTGGGG
eukprot:365566-Chlamydomonas_euryale.AAC.5